MNKKDGDDGAQEINYNDFKIKTILSDNKFKETHSVLSASQKPSSQGSQVRVHPRLGINDHYLVIL